MGFFRKRHGFISSGRWSFNLGGRWTYLTALLVTVLVVIFVFAYGNRRAATEISTLSSVFSISYPAIANGEVWRIFTAPFYFSGMLQLLFSCMAIYFCGGYVARRLGFSWFMIAYIACGATGGLASIFIVPEGRFEAAPPAVYGIILLCMLYFPYMRFLGSATARQLGPVLIGSIVLTSLNFNSNDTGYLAQLAALPTAYIIFKLEPAVQHMRSRWRLRREIIDAFTEAEREEHLDRLLKKVAQEGMDSLNRKERHFLQTVSKEYRRKKVKNNH
jgi:membrane associated rhomboid family serine protease